MEAHMLLAMEIWLGIFFGLMVLAIVGGWIDQAMRHRVVQVKGGSPARHMVPGIAARW
jgi:hypothetical protein